MSRLQLDQSRIGCRILKSFGRFMSIGGELVMGCVGQGVSVWLWVLEFGVQSCGLRRYKPEETGEIREGMESK